MSQSTRDVRWRTSRLALAQDADGLMMSRPVPSDDTDPYEPWDPFECSSQQNTQATSLSFVGMRTGIPIASTIVVLSTSSFY
jgi:hypothetical protein